MTAWLRHFTALVLLTLTSVCAGAYAPAWETKTAHRGFVANPEVAASENAALSAGRIKEKSLRSTDSTSDLLIYAYANPTVYIDPTGRIQELVDGADMIASCLRREKRGQMRHSSSVNAEKSWSLPTTTTIRKNYKSI